jgi:diguanylate cyclase (GGDEF)-like protein
MTAPDRHRAQSTRRTVAVPGEPDSGGRHALGPDLEAAYVRARLLSQRTLIRVACSSAALLAILRTAEQMRLDAWHPAQPFVLATVAAASVLLAAAAFLPAFARVYLPIARVVVPGRNLLAAIFVTGAAAQGRAEMLMLLPLMIVGPYFFLGLSQRAALGSVLFAFGGFLVGASYFGLALPTALDAGALLGVATVASAIAARNLDRLARRSFLETQRMSSLAVHDALTGLKNRRIFDDRLHAVWTETVDDQRTLAILMIDIDYFKGFNDRNGHLAGDQALRRVAQTLQGFVEGPPDLLARYGGEEFAAIVRNLDVRAAGQLAERMRGAVEKLEIREREGRPAAPLTVSIGVAVVDPTLDRDPRGAVQLADQALYEAKLRGRNRVAIKDQSAYELLKTGVFDMTSMGELRLSGE